MKSRVFVLSLLLYCSVPFDSVSQDVTGSLKVTFINVGQADAIFVECPTSDHFMLIDAADTRYPGSAGMFKHFMDSIKQNVTSKINLVVASHPHADHIGSMKWVLQTFDVVNYLDNGDQYESATYDSLMALLYRQVESGDLLYEALETAQTDFVDFCPAMNVTTMILRPEDNLDNCSNANNCSVIIRLDYNTSSFLFVGDAEYESEEKLLHDKPVSRKLNVDVLKAGHHGSNTSSSYDFLKRISPKYIVVSVGEKDRGTNNGYRHPRLSSVEAFNRVLKTKAFRDEEVQVYDTDNSRWVSKKVKARVYFTHLDGNVTIVTDGRQISKQP